MYMYQVSELGKVAREIRYPGRDSAAKSAV